MNTRSSRPVWALYRWVLPLLLGGLMWGCRSNDSALPTLRVGHASHDHHAPLFIAGSLAEYFREHGGVYLEPIRAKSEYRLLRGDRPLARVLIDSATGGRALIQRLAEDQFDLVFGSFPSMVRSIQQGSPIRVVAPVMAGGNGLVVRRGLPVNNWQQFVQFAMQSEKPVRVGCKAAVSVQSFLFEEALRGVGLSYSWDLDDKEVQVVLLDLHGPENLIPALEQGLLDGFVVMQPYLARAEERQVGRTILYFENLAPEGETILYPCCALAARSEYLAQHRDVVDALVDLLRQASRVIEQDPDLAARVVAGWLDEPVAMENKSLRSVTFVSDFDDEWTRGANEWVERLVQLGKMPPEARQQAHSGELWRRVVDPAGRSGPGAGVE